MPTIRASRIDAAVSDAFLTALAPAELDALTRARQAQQQVDKALRASAERELERKRYAVALAERQFNRVDPDNRLVAGELERRWEAALSELRAAEECLARPPAEPARRTELGQDLNNKVVALFDSLPQIWASGTTTDAHRKALLRCLIEKVVLNRGERDIALARIVWRGGAVTELHVKMKVNSIAKLTHGEELRARLLDLARTGMPDDEIAETLTSEGHRSPDCADKVLPITVQRVRLGAGIKISEQRNRWIHDPTLLSAVQLAARLNIPVNWIYVQIRRKRLLIDQQPTGAYLFQNSDTVINAVTELRNHTVSHLDLRITQLHQEGYQHA